MMKDIIVTALYNLGYVLIFPGFLFCFFAGLLLCGIDRKLGVARNNGCDCSALNAENRHSELSENQNIV